MRLEDAIARNIVRLRNDRGWTQSELAARMRSIGFSGWQSNRVTQIETLRRHATMLETIYLSGIFSVPFTELFEGEGPIELPGATGEVTTVDLASIRAIITGDVQQMVSRGCFAGDPRSDEMRKIAKKLQIPPHALDRLTRRVYGQSLIEEREARVGDTAGLGKHSLQGKRGNVTRTLTAELAGIIRVEGSCSASPHGRVS